MISYIDSCGYSRRLQLMVDPVPERYSGCVYIAAPR